MIGRDNEGGAIGVRWRCAVWFDNEKAGEISRIILDIFGNNRQFMEQGCLAAGDCCYVRVAELLHIFDGGRCVMKFDTSGVGIVGAEIIAALGERDGVGIHLFDVGARSADELLMDGDVHLANDGIAV